MSRAETEAPLSGDSLLRKRVEPRSGVKGIVMSVESCIPIPSGDLEKKFAFVVDGLGFSMSSEMHENGELIFSHA
jgi:hypothetical protein